MFAIEDTVLEIALPVPLYQTFDYLIPFESKHTHYLPGMRVRVPFGNRTMTGVLLSTKNNSSVTKKKLKHALAILDETPLLPPLILSLITWVSQYYQAPIGEVIQAALPKLLREGEAAVIREMEIVCWRLTPAGWETTAEQLTRAPKQWQAIRLLRQHSAGVKQDELVQQNYREAIRVLEKKGCAEKTILKQTPIATIAEELPLTLNVEQQEAVEKILAKENVYQTTLLHGITGSGKTEVYLQVIAKILAANKQVLVLVPEINLTPQTYQRFLKRFNVPIAVLHSGLNDTERLQAWLRASQDGIKIIVGTRSAIFTPLPNLGLIVIDEEHDLSLKQQHGFSYSARDIAIMRAYREHLPIILGSATPSLESLQQAWAGNYQYVALTTRAGGAHLPTFSLIDIRTRHLQAGLTPVLIQCMQEHLERGEQVLLFLNRRGYAPTLICHQCGWVADCRKCHAHLTLHLSPNYLQCHHCGGTRQVDKRCPTCQQENLHAVGTGTEKLEQVIKEYFPNYKVARMDRDATKRKNAMQNLLKDIHSGKKQILIGTQMLAKGHDFPNVTLVGIINADTGLMSGDFRGTERFGQLLLQVSGRAGRAEKPGRVLIQTHYPEHPLLQQLIRGNYNEFAKILLEERQSMGWPPFSYLALLRAEALGREKTHLFLQTVKYFLLEKNISQLSILGPITALMEKKKDYYRAQLLLQTQHRSVLQKCLPQLIEKIKMLPLSHQIRWRLDVDPQELG